MTKVAPDRALAVSYPHIYPMQVAEVSAESAIHVSNIETTQYFDRARVAMMEAILGRGCCTDSLGDLVLPYNTTVYGFEAASRATIVVGGGILRVGNSSVTLAAERVPASLFRRQRQ
jgi:acyl-CoA thioesterase FadM